jgi:gluconokinase
MMGVAGAGKTTVGRLVADSLGVPFVDGDDLHSPEQIDQMRRGIPLDDEDRRPWLDKLHAILKQHRTGGVVLACSALKRSYRERLGEGLDVHFVALVAPREELERRLAERHGHYVGVALLDSQLETLELDSDVTVVDADRAPDAVAADVLADTHVVMRRVLRGKNGPRAPWWRRWFGRATA